MTVIVVANRVVGVFLLRTTIVGATAVATIMLLAATHKIVRNLRFPQTLPLDKSILWQISNHERIRTLVLTINWTHHSFSRLLTKANQSERLR